MPTMKLSNKNRSERARSRYITLRQRKERRRRFTRRVLRGVLWILFAVIYYVTYSTYFDTSLESRSRNSINQLEDEYMMLLARYDTLEVVLNYVSERDSLMFRNMFDAPLDLEDAPHRKSRVDELEAFLELSNGELSEELNRQTLQLEELSNQIEQSYKQMILKVDSIGVDARKIPSIQPVANSSLNKLIASYGVCMHPFYRTMKMHEGVDYLLPEGTRVFATADGVVEATSNLNSTSGKTITINHGNGYRTIYKHLNSINVRKKQRVKRGDIIALSGNSGLSLSPHLHYEIRYNEQSVDPIHYFFLELTPEEYQQIQKIAQSRRQSFD
ncbi:MAG: M23 family metallopeptidase [Rikenellaceae bacterium]